MAMTAMVKVRMMTTVVVVVVMVVVVVVVMVVVVRRAWHAAVHGVTKSWTRLSD